MENTTHKIPLQALLASMLFTTNHNFGCYLNYIKVQKGYVAASDCYCLFKCDIDGLDKEFDLFVHPHQIKLLVQGIKKKDKQGDVTIEVIENDGASVVIMRFGERTVTFDKIKDVNYPDINRAIPSDDEANNAIPILNWNYMAKMQTAGKILGNKTPPSIKSTGKNKPVLIDFGAIKFNAVGVVAPIKE